MAERLTEYQESLVLICVDCGAWLPPIRLCTTCGRAPRAEWMPFYEIVLHLNHDVGRELYEMQPGRMFNAQRVQRDTHAGAGVELLGIVSGIVLGIVSNAGYDLIKTWLLSNKKRVEAERTLSHQYRYEIVVEILVEHFERNPELKQMIVHSLTGAGLIAASLYTADAMTRDAADEDVSTAPPNLSSGNDTQ